MRNIFLTAAFLALSTPALAESDMSGIYGGYLQGRAQQAEIDRLETCNNALRAGLAVPGCGTVTTLAPVVVQPQQPSRTQCIRIRDGFVTCRQY